MADSSDASSSTSTSNDGIDLFTEPPDYYAPPAPPTFIDYTFHPPALSHTPPTTTSSDPITLHLRLVGHNPLWGHHLWNAGRILASYLQTHRARLVSRRRVWELGAGAGLPSLVAWACGAQDVLVTDYPDGELVENLERNVQMVRERVREWHTTASPSTTPAAAPSEKGYGEIRAQGYLWGQPVPGLTDGGEGYDTLILGDLLFNHSEHASLLKSVVVGMKRSGTALVFFTPYRPWLLEEDLKFFEMARQEGLVVRKVGEEVLPEVMFKEDRGDELLRRTVFMYELRWPGE